MAHEVALEVGDVDGFSLEQDVEQANSCVHGVMKGDASVGAALVTAPRLRPVLLPPQLDVKQGQ